MPSLYGESYEQGLFDAKVDRDACGVGFVVNAKGKASNFVITQAMTMLERMDHRGACACDESSGDGAGVMTAIPHEIFLQHAKNAGVTLPDRGGYAAGNIFVESEEFVDQSIATLEQIATQQALKVLFWRRADVDKSVLGVISALREPVCVQVVLVPEFVSELDADRFRFKAFVVRKKVTNVYDETRKAYICSLDPATIVYKGMLTAAQLFRYYGDLASDQFESHFAVVHNRFSTNTFPSWPRAHPQRMTAHNGEINTLRGNVNYSYARQGRMEHAELGDKLTELFDVVEAGQSDSGSFDNLMEFLLRLGNRQLPELVMSMVPEAWQHDPSVSEMKRDFYKCAASLLEPWDGPALIVFADGRYVGAVLDRNGLRPARCYTTDDDMVYMASEVGVFDIPAGVRVLRKKRLQAGRLLLVDTETGALLDDERLKEEICSRQPYSTWLKRGAVHLDQLRQHYSITDDEVREFVGLDENVLLADDRRLPLFGYSPENLNLLLLPMIKTDKEALGSMGNDAPLACLSQFNPTVFEYFKQLFAQVTNPPIDPFRERIVMSLLCPIGREGNSLQLNEAATHRLWLSHPILSLKEMILFRRMQSPKPSDDHPSEVFKWRSYVLDATCERVQLGSGADLKAALLRLCAEAEDALSKSQATILIVSDRNVSKDRLPIPSLLALGAIHQHLVRLERRMECALIVESGEAKEVHHFCTLVGFGADAICPYLIMESFGRLQAEGLLDREVKPEQFFANYTASVERGLFKVMAKMGISTLHSYKSAQIFEAVGLAEEVVELCFTRTASRISGTDFNVLAAEMHNRANFAYPPDLSQAVESHATDVFARNAGFYHWRAGGEKHMNDPDTIANLQDASKNKSKAAYDAFVRNSDASAENCTLRGQLDLIFAEQPVPLEEVEEAKEIVKRFATGAMSLGSISNEAHTALAEAMNILGARSNTGEGGERPERYLDPKIRSSIKQVASARFGVNSSYLAHADMLQIKMAQGAKPGEGGELPGHKVTVEIARTRNATPGVGLISPPPHHDIYSIEDLAQLIYDLKCANPTAYVSVKLVSEIGVGVVAAGVAKGQAAHITVSGHDGGTGASSWTGIKHAGLPWELGISETHQVLVHNHLRSRVLLQADGQIRTGRDVVFAAILGADEFGMSTAPLITLGCTMMRKCHLNTCPVGVATQDPELRKKFAGAPESLVNYFFLLAEEVRSYLARLGLRSVAELIGRTDLVKMRTSLSEKSTKLDFTAVLKKPEREGVRALEGLIVHEDPDSRILVNPSLNLNNPTAHDNFCRTLAEALPEDRRLDKALLKQAAHLIDTPPGASLGSDALVRVEETIGNEDRCFGASLSYAISMRYCEDGLPEGRLIEVNLTGSAGQSFGAFLAKGVKLRLEGDANDYVGKGLSGGQLIIVPPADLLQKKAGKRPFLSQENMLVGNIALYGAIRGRVFIRGRAAERFCVRNSGAEVVVEGVGQHGCEYMTGGRVVILGPTGRNFAAGMSGGLAFVLDKGNTFHSRCNTELVELEGMHVEHEQAQWLHDIITAFAKETESEVASDLLTHWTEAIKLFKLVFPVDYRKALKKAKENQTTNIIAQTPKPISKATKDIEDFAMMTESEPLDKLRGFMRYSRNPTAYRAVGTRLADWAEVHDHKSVRRHLRKQAARCMDCGVPFCQSSTGCPLGNLIPNWNDLVFKNDWNAAHLALSQTNNFPEFTGRVCPAPCEGACVLGINSDPVTIKHVECAIADTAWLKGWNAPKPPTHRTGKRVAVVGSGPSGLACAAQLNSAGHSVVVFERRNLPGGLLRYGIPTMKLGRDVLDRRLELMRAEGVEFRCAVHVGKNSPAGDANSNVLEQEAISSGDLLAEFDAVSLCLGATWPRDIDIPSETSTPFSE